MSETTPPPEEAAPQPDAAPPDETTPAPGPKKRGLVSREFVIVLIVGIVLACAAGWLKDDIRGFFALQRWSPKSAAAQAEKFAGALRAGDQATLTAMSPGIQLEMEGNRVVKVKPGGAPPQMPMMDGAECTARVPLEDAKFEYRLSQSRVRIVSVGEAYPHVATELESARGKWRIVTVMPVP